GNLLVAVELDVRFEEVLVAPGAVDLAADVSGRQGDAEFVGLALPNEEVQKIRDLGSAAEIRFLLRLLEVQGPGLESQPRRDGIDVAACFRVVLDIGMVEQALDNSQTPLDLVLNLLPGGKPYHLHLPEDVIHLLGN